jgi:hypothetical protein
MSAVAVLYFHFHFSGNPVLQYLRPRFLPNRGHSKVVYRQAGTSLLILALWLATTTATAFSLIPRSLLEHSRILMAVVCFAIPVAVVMALVVSIYYLGVGIFARAATVSPAFRSILETDAAQLDLYVKRMTRCTRINLMALALTFGLPCLEALAGVEPKGIVVLVNVACLVTFILSLWRLRAYCVNVAMSLGGSGRDVLLSTLGGPSAIFFVWRHSFALQRQYQEYRSQLTRQPAPPPLVPDAHLK